MTSPRMTGDCRCHFPHSDEFHSTEESLGLQRVLQVHESPDAALPLGRGVFGRFWGRQRVSEGHRRIGTSGRKGEPGSQASRLNKQIRDLTQQIRKTGFWGPWMAMRFRFMTNLSGQKPLRELASKNCGVHEILTLLLPCQRCLFCSWHRKYL